MRAQGSKAIVYRVMALTRLIRYAVYVSILIMLWWMLSRFSFIQIEQGDDSISGFSGYRRLLVGRLGEDGHTVERGEVLVFAIRDASDQRIFRVSRVVGVPGDRVEEADGRYVINGEPTEIQVSDRLKPGFQVPERAYFLVNDNPFSRYADSLRLGLIQRQWVIGRFLSEMPF